MLIIAIHGILTGQTRVNWTDAFDAWMFRRDPEVKVLKKEYRAGPFPRWNHFVRNAQLAEALANEVALLAAAHSRDTTRFPRTWLVAHSNGADIALQTTRKLIARGGWVRGILLTGGACEADLARNGIRQWTRSRRLGSAIAYCSAQDTLLPRPWTLTEGLPLGERLRSACWGWLAWPYGSLGRTGWLLEGRPYEPAFNDPELLPVTTRWFTGGHSCYFAPSEMERTFELFYQDMQNSEF